MFRFICSALMVAGSTAASANAQPTQVSRADLSITIAYRSSIDNVRVFIKNQGTISTAACTMSVKHFSSAGALLGQSSVQVPSVAAGATVLVNTTVANMAPGSHVTIKVDSTNIVVELKESNNEYRFFIPTNNP